MEFSFIILGHIGLTWNLVGDIIYETTAQISPIFDFLISVFLSLIEGQILAYHGFWQNKLILVDQEKVKAVKIVFFLSFCGENIVYKVVYYLNLFTARPGRGHWNFDHLHRWKISVIYPQILIRMDYDWYFEWMVEVQRYVWPK